MGMGEKVNCQNCFMGVYQKIVGTLEIFGLPVFLDFADRFDKDIVKNI
jgi:hypothetical protein